MITLFIRDCQGKPDPKDNKGETPLHYAVRNQKLKVIAKLVGELGVYPNPYTLKQVPTPLDLAKSGGLKSIADYLKRVGAKTTKEMKKASRNTTASSINTATTVHSSNSSTFSSGESSTSADSLHGPTTAVTGVRQYLHTKTSQILRSTFDL
jgi:ankyrin repeat protein